LEIGHESRKLKAQEIQQIQQISAEAEIRDGSVDGYEMPNEERVCDDPVNVANDKQAALRRTVLQSQGNDLIPSLSR